MTEPTRHSLWKRKDEPIAWRKNVWAFEGFKTHKPLRILDKPEGGQRIGTREEDPERDYVYFCGPVIEPPGHMHLMSRQIDRAEFDDEWEAVQL